MDYHRFQCFTCSHRPEFDQKGFVNHLRNTHHLGQSQGVRNLIQRDDSHLHRGASYRWTFDVAGVFVEAVETFGRSLPPPTGVVGWYVGTRHPRRNDDGNS